MKLRIFTVDAFTSKPFEGNPAAIVPLDQNLEDEVLQKIAFEMNISETAFLTAPPGTTLSWTHSSRFGLRWLTPKSEVALCGHATLAAAHTLFFILGNQSSVLEFETLSGILFAKREGENIVLDFPLNPGVHLSSTESELLAPLVKAVVAERRVEEVVLSPTTKKFLIRLDDSYTRNDIESISPDPRELSDLQDGSVVRGIILTLKGELQETADSTRGLGNYHFVSRYFAPWVGIAEDPVTGSAHTVLAPYWSSQLGIKDLKCRQCSPRGGDLTLKLRNDGRVDIAGKATTVIEGYINI